MSYTCKLDSNFVTSKTYNQTTMTNGMSETDAKNECIRRAEKAGNKDFFFQQHNNNHTICGIYDEKLEMNDQFVKHGHKFGQVCEYDPTANDDFPDSPNTDPILQNQDVWGTTDDNQVFKHVNGKWHGVFGDLKQVTGNDNVMAAVNDAGDIFTCVKPCNGQWKKTNGSLAQVSLGTDRLWGVNASQQIFSRRIANDGVFLDEWKQIAGHLTHVSASNQDAVWGVNRNGTVFRCDGKCETANWVQDNPGKSIKQISGGKNHVYAIDSDGLIHKKATANGSWEQINGILDYIDASNQDEVWGVNSANDVFKCNQPCNGSWSLVDRKDTNDVDLPFKNIN